MSDARHARMKRRGLIVRRWAAYARRRAEDETETDELPPAVDEEIAEPQRAADVWGSPTDPLS